jgi:hypothetical protein
MKKIFYSLAVSSVLATTIFGDVNLSNGLVAHYEFEGNADDSSGNGNDGTEYGGVGYVDGVIGQAGSFGYNITDYIEVTKDFELGTEWTISEWVKLNENSGHIISIATSSHPNEFVVLPYKHTTNYSKYGKFHFVINDYSLAKGTVSIPNIRDVNWHLVTISSDRSNVSFYIDGKLYQTFTDLADLDITSENLIIGQEQDSLGGGFELSNSTNGLIDDLRIYNRALSQEEITALYNQKYNLNITQGWNLIALDSNLSSLPSEIPLIWQFENENWSAFSPSGEFSSTIVSEGFETISENLSSEKGTWVLADTNFTLQVLPKEETETNSSNWSYAPIFPNLMAQNDNWNLMGTDIEIPAKGVVCKNGEVKQIWKYVDNGWLLFVDGVDISQFSNMFDKIEANRGFWTLCQ